MKAIIKGIELTYNKNTGKISKMSNWNKCYELARNGLIGSNYYKNLYGHVDFFVKEYKPDNY